MSDDPTVRILAAIERLVSDIRAQGAELKALRSDVTSLGSEVAKRIDRLQDAVRAQRELEVGKLDAGERAERIALGASDEARIIGEQVNAMIRQIQHLQREVQRLAGGA